MNINGIKDFRKIINEDETISYLITIPQNNNLENETYLISPCEDDSIIVKRITNIIAFVENKNIIISKNINADDFETINHFIKIINNNHKEKNNEFKNNNIDNQYYDEYIKLHDKKKGI